MQDTIHHAKSIVFFAVTQPLSFLYIVIQDILNWVFAPAPPPPTDKLHRPRIAVIGAGLTGVSSAAHCVGHGFDVKIFEARSREKGLGGIWSVSCFGTVIRLFINDHTCMLMQHFT
jgi:NAD(P)-binding Rossmann-like domain